MKREGIILPSVKEIGDGKYSKWFLLVIFKLRSCNGGHVPLLLLVSFFFFIKNKKKKITNQFYGSLYVYCFSTSLDGGSGSTTSAQLHGHYGVLSPLSLVTWKPRWQELDLRAP
jgi:hypothetical protein